MMEKHVLSSRRAQGSSSLFPSLFLFQHVAPSQHLLEFCWGNFPSPLCLGLASNSACPTVSGWTCWVSSPHFPDVVGWQLFDWSPTRGTHGCQRRSQVMLQRWPTRCQSLCRISHQEGLSESCSRLFAPQCPGSFHPSPSLPPPLPVASFSPLCPTLCQVNKSPIAYILFGC